MTGLDFLFFYTYNENKFSVISGVDRVAGKERGIPMEKREFPFVKEPYSNLTTRGRLKLCLARKSIFLIDWVNENI